MHATPTVLDRTTVSLTPRGHLAVQLSRLRKVLRALGPADRAWAADALVLLLAECRDAVPANKKGA
jgi:hypothetical protein